LRRRAEIRDGCGRFISEWNAKGSLWILREDKQVTERDNPQDFAAGMVRATLSMRKHESATLSGGDLRVNVISDHALVLADHDSPALHFPRDIVLIQGLQEDVD
jgi:hypothetical protein